MKFTPGPWHIEDASYGQIVCADKADVAVVRNSDGLPHHENARLIAASPDLLEALRSIVEDYAFCEQNPVFGDRVHEYVKTARAAIAKAEGTS